MEFKESRSLWKFQTNQSFYFQCFSFWSLIIFFRMRWSCPQPANIFLSQHFLEMPLLENVKFTLF
jgi:hypothetical protein